MKKIVITVTIIPLLTAAAAFTGDIIGRHNLSHDRELVRVKSVEGNKMAVDIIYAPVKGKLAILMVVCRPDSAAILFQTIGRPVPWIKSIRHLFYGITEGNEAFRYHSFA